MNKIKKDKKDRDAKKIPQKKEAPPDKAETLKLNPNPYANGNVPDEKKKQRAGNTEGVGSEITDGEDG